MFRTRDRARHVAIETSVSRLSFVVKLCGPHTMREVAPMPEA